METKETLTQRIKEDFGEWSGGFPPESPEQIEIYIEAARPGDTDAEAVRALLIDWMNDDENT